MEESEKRRERLRAMRDEASQIGATNETNSKFHQLSNPLIESPSLETNSRETQRFDYYTDPMAAFSNDKRMSYQNPPGSFNRFPTPRNPETTPPAHQVRPAYSPNPRMFQPRSPYHQPQTPNYYSGPINPISSPAHQGQFGHFQPQPPYANIPSPSSGPRNPSMSPAHQGQSGHFQPRPSNYNPISGSGPRNPSMSPARQGQSCHFPGQAPYPNPSLGSGPRNMSPAHQGQFGHFQGRHSNQSPSLGRGRGGNRGFGSHGSVSAEVRPDLYYNKSMVEDPWKNLEPSIWKIEVSLLKSFNKTPDSRKPLHSDTFGTKKARVSEDSKGASSQPSLAEYLAAAFNEAVGEESSENKSNP